MGAQQTECTEGRCTPENGYDDKSRGRRILSQENVCSTHIHTVSSGHTMKCPQVCVKFSRGESSARDQHLPPGSGALNGNWEKPTSYPGVPTALCLPLTPCYLWSL